MPDTLSGAPAADLYPVEEILTMAHNAAQQGRLTLWTIYDRPKDFPHQIVARRHEMPGGPTECYLIGELDYLRSSFKAAGLHCLPRAPEDDRKIVETWI